MGILGMSNARAGVMASMGKSGKEIRKDAKNTFGLAGENQFVENWANYADGKSQIDLYKEDKVESKVWYFTKELPDKFLKDNIEVVEGRNSKNQYGYFICAYKKDISIIDRIFNFSKEEPLAIQIKEAGVEFDCRRRYIHVQPDHDGFVCFTYEENDLKAFIEYMKDEYDREPISDMKYEYLDWVGRETYQVNY